MFLPVRRLTVRGSDCVKRLFAIRLNSLVVRNAIGPGISVISDGIVFVENWIKITMVHLLIIIAFNYISFPRKNTKNFNPLRKAIPHPTDKDNLANYGRCLYSKIFLSIKQ